ncbi:MAG: hypothetical protein ACD_81C00139G0003 [uncultured bacterium]|uniref:Uncharacterized protein n=2 Tax=Candidatus Wolfeibacteriota TaxID=1752735 RepID=A0A0G1K5W8_9BACT|nr:MAG: hypothetical protein ACD_81C00139G0003 [uncultured bacterium]KKR12311.1 MAG: hypothetical protein UT41_C0002G0085 [Candidatus Wolfebacteria bacterium GW2011_GWC2_39_22]KKT43219.1 MAG: hypothetical protein UW32_C0002G0080 [Candidatus Wolfebacteria bacterium GW2011_GWE2_44_13]HBI25941.1 hypothetical protein [Candidatus Wolfebacteria bacterium]
MKLFLAVCAASLTGSAIALHFHIFQWICAVALIILGVRFALCLFEAYRHNKKISLLFFKHLFLCIHFDFLLLFVGDVAIGITVGYFSGDILFGGLAGGGWWLLDYQLITTTLMRTICKTNH